uniref:Mos1 transposase HTH domain-containing protein n=1 Tax=Glossina palpalis gambiensis TaxID=67801 RepID=A0A1B0BDA7_9MUSC
MSCKSLRKNLMTHVRYEWHASLFNCAHEIWFIAVRMTLNNPNRDRLQKVESRLLRRHSLWELFEITANLSRNRQRVSYYSSSKVRFDRDSRESILKRFPFNTVSEKKPLRHVMLHCRKKSSGAKDTTDDIFTVHASGSTTIKSVRNWFKKFRAVNFDLKDEDRKGRLATMYTEFVKSMLAEISQYCVHEIVDATTIPRTI